jgi:glycogen operon protein
MMSTLLLAQGTPMILAGDEFGRTQGGNNNAYCQDNEISWLNWDLKEKGHALIEFVKCLNQMRHQYPILRRNRFLAGTVDEELGIKDLTWINANGGEMQESDWRDGGMRCFGMLLDGRARTTGLPQRGKEVTLLLAINGHYEDVQFTLPECESACRWVQLIDTKQTEQPGGDRLQKGASFSCASRSFSLFKMESDG